MKLKFKKLHPDAILPTYATDGAACFDLYARADVDTYDGAALPIEFFEDCKFRTGLAVEVPPGYVLKVYSRSGHGFKYSTTLANSVGIIDSDYRGEIVIALFNHGVEPFVVRKGDRIAQAMLSPAPQVEIVEATELSETVRSAGGFGSTGA